MNSPLQSLPLPPVYYEEHGQNYYLPDAQGKWIKVNEGSAKRKIRSAGFGDSAANGISEAEQCLLDIQCQQNVAYAGRLAGYNAGFYVINGKKVLVTESPQLITPREGDWPAIHAVVEGMFRLNDECDQRPYLYGWLKRSLECFYSRRWMQGQVLAMAGPKRSAKSLVQALFTEMFGGRQAKPFMFMSGRTDFNSELFEAEHLVFDDEVESSNYNARITLGAHIKQVAGVKAHQCHGKHKTGLVLTPLWRMTISLNDEPGRLLVLPPLDQDLDDKLILLKVARKEMPMPTESGEEKEWFWNTLMAELPAFIHFLLHQWQIAPELVCPRFGIKHYHHPDLVLALKETAPETSLLGLIDAVLFNTGLLCGQQRPLELTALQVQGRLLDNDNRVARQAEQLLRYHNACGTYLSRLIDQGNTRISKRVVHGQAIYTIQPPVR